MTLVGSKLRHFNIVAALGQGGMGDVYAAYDENLKRKVAVKAISPGRGLTPAAKARFLREAQLLSQLDHPGICRIFDYLEIDGSDFLILELIEGQTLREADEDLDFGAKLDIAIQIAAVLDTAHTEGIVHRDLKPDNVMLTPDGLVKLLDFGLARSLDEESGDPVDDSEVVDPTLADQDRTLALTLDTTMPGIILGTPMFMSPEQANSEPVTPAADLYSFGLLLQWLFTGVNAYEPTEDMDTMLHLVGQAKTLPAQGIDSDLAALIERLKSRSPARRPTALAAKEKLEWIRGKPRRRNQRFIAAAILVAVLLAGFKYTTDLRAERMIAEQNRAQAEDLMGFMLGDLRDKLEPVGRLDVLDDVGRKALEYYASRRDEDLGDEEYFKLSKAMTQIGDVRMAQGDMEAARQAFDEALITAEKLVKRDPSNPEWLAGLGAVHFWIGSILFSQGNLDEAETRFVTYLDVARQLEQLEPGNPDWRMETAYGYTNLAALAEERGDHTAALENIQSSIAIKRELSANQPENPALKSHLANSLGWAGRMRDKIGDRQGALVVLQEAETVLEELIAEDPANTNHQELLSITLHLIASMQRDLGKDEAALSSYRADLDIISGLVQRDPENFEWRAGLATTKRTLGLHLIRMNRVAEAGPFIHQGDELVREVLARDPENIEHQFQTANSRLALARLELAQDRPEPALAWLDESVAEIKARYSGPPDKQASLALGETLLMRGVALERMGQRERAVSDWESAREILEPLKADSKDAGYLLAWCHLMAVTGNRVESQAVASRLAGQDYARADFLDLCREFDLVID